MVERYLQMGNGRFGETAKRLADEMLGMGNQAGHGIMDMLTSPVFKGHQDVDNNWKPLAKQFREACGLLFNKYEGFGESDGVVVFNRGRGRCDPVPGRLGVSAKFWHQVCDDALAFIKSYQALAADWRKGREAWEKERDAWCADHGTFMDFFTGPWRDFEAHCEAAREEAQAAAGQTVTHRKRQRRGKGRRRGRWHLWYEYVEAHPELNAWRGRATAADFAPVPEEVQREIRTRAKRPEKQIPRLLDWLREHNPEIASLEKTLDTYLDQHDRFRRPPTLTLPSPEGHPRWFNLEKDVFYKEADFGKGTVNLCLVDECDGGAWVLRWFESVRIECDPRLKPAHRTEVFRREGRLPPLEPGKAGRKFDRPAASPEERKAGVGGAKLILRPKSEHLVFAVKEQDGPPRARWKKRAGRTCSADSLHDAAGEPLGAVRVLAIDLGVRHIGGFAVAEGVRGEPGWMVTIPKRGLVDAPELPALTEMRRHERALRKGRRERGKPVDGERSFIALQDHRTDMADDRFKKAAHAIVETARRFDAHVIVFEKLDTLKPTARNERWANRELRAMNRRHIVDAVQLTAPEFGFPVDEGVSPYLTSHLCSACLRPGWRFSMKRKDPRSEGRPRGQCVDFGYPVWEPGGHLFRCPHCGYRGHADLNAAGNIAHRFFGTFPADVRRKGWIYTLPDGSTWDPRPDFEAWAGPHRERRLTGETPF
ncbi:MAG: zinc ribbon domain-containing protein [Planctomycetota bacterium]